jgi:putative protein-disulfide isomerase
MTGIQIQTNEVSRKNAPIMADRKLIYVADPMCSWCWGFAPVIRKIVDSTDDHAEFSIILGGLRSETKPVSEERKAMYREVWPQIQKQTGQSFNCSLVESADFIYDTEPACRAVVAARSMEGDLKALEMFDHLQFAFYSDNIDITQKDHCVAIAAQLGIDQDFFSDLFTSNKVKRTTQHDFKQAQAIGATGFPTVIVADGPRRAFLTCGYQPFGNLRGQLEHLLEHGLH